MGIFDKLEAIDAQLEADLKRLADKGKQTSQGEWQKKEDEKNKKRDNKAKSIKTILEDDTEGIDEPHLYTIKYEYIDSEAFAYITEERSIDVIMTEREKRMAEVTGKLIHWVKTEVLAFENDFNGIIGVERASREETEEEKVKIEAIRKKVDLINESEEESEKCVIDLYDKEFGNIPVNTSLKYALLSSLNIENGKVNYMNKEETKLPANQMSKITFRGIKRAIARAFNKGNDKGEK